MNRRELKSDILIVGGGGAAAAAAIEARSYGVSVTIASKDNFVGGATITASGGASVPLSEGDSPEVYFGDILASGGHINDRRLARVLANNAGHVLTDVESLGGLLDRSAPDRFNIVKKSEGHSYPRAFLDRREGLEMSHTLAKAARDRGATVLEDTIVTRLLAARDGSRGVVGAVGVDLRDGQLIVFRSKVVILATGGYGQLYETTTNPTTLTGDGHRLAYHLGAEFVDMEMVQFAPLGLPFPPSLRGILLGMCSLFGPKVKLLNAGGERYMRRYDAERMEYSTRDVVARANFIEIREGRGTEGGAVVVDTTENDPALLARYRSSTPDIYHRIAEAYGEEAASWKKPFEAIPTQHFCMGGIRIDERCRTGVPGLLAAGEIVGGVHGANRLSGAAVPEIIVFGQVAGKTAAGLALALEMPPLEEEEVAAEERRLDSIGQPSAGQGLRPGEIRRKLQKVGSEKLGLVRSEDGLSSALAEIERLRREDLPRVKVANRSPVWNREWLEAVELESLVLVAEMVARSALLRRESRGAHFREDFPEISADWERNVVVSRAVDGLMIVGAPRCVEGSKS